jgi:1-acyl-sn-glycerol-3-phosphate acyltransferase
MEKSSWIYYLAKFIVRAVLVLFTRWEVKGSANVPQQGAFLVVANHIALPDSPVLVVSVKRQLALMAKDEVFHPAILGYLMKRFKAFPVKRGQIDRNALRTARRVLDNGMGLVMFPEGTRSRNTQLQNAFPGAAMLASFADVPIVPVGLSGTENVKGIRFIFHRPRVTVNIGKPFRVPGLDNESFDKSKLAEYTDDIMLHIAVLLPPEYRGQYADRVKVSA